MIIVFLLITFAAVTWKFGNLEISQFTQFGIFQNYTIWKSGNFPIYAIWNVGNFPNYSS
jgi:hypothetical protein